MPMLDNQCNSLDNQENPNIAQALWMNFQSADMNSQWKLCSGSAIQWVNNGALVGFEYSGAASIALSVTGTAQDADNYQPNNKFFGAAEVERVLGEILRGMEIKPYPNYPALLDAAMLSYEKMQPDKKLSPSPSRETSSSTACPTTSGRPPTAPSTCPRSGRTRSPPGPSGARARAAPACTSGSSS